jgi:hypothetical protein
MNEGYIFVSFFLCIDCAQYTYRGVTGESKDTNWSFLLSVMILLGPHTMLYWLGLWYCTWYGMWWGVFVRMLKLHRLIWCTTSMSKLIIDALGLRPVSFSSFSFWCDLTLNDAKKGKYYGSLLDAFFSPFRLPVFIYFESYLAHFNDSKFPVCNSVNQMICWYQCQVCTT